MQRFKDKIAFIIATKDRPQELRRLLRSFESQSFHPDQIIIVDGGDELVADINQEFSSLPIKYMRCVPPSAARQRNLGIRAVNQEATLIGFLDDDTVLEADSLAAMMSFWIEAPEHIGGAGFNMINSPEVFASGLKSLPLAERLGLYSRNKGVVLSSGFHTTIGYETETKFVDWLPTCGVVWRKKIFDEFQFDEWFYGYSYLEDLDFSYRVAKKYRLAYIANAQYYHCPALQGRGSSYEFGKKEVVNRLYFLKKNQELSLPKCYIALIIRIFLSLCMAMGGLKANFFQRVSGNIVGLLQTLLRTE